MYSSYKTKNCGWFIFVYTCKAMKRYILWTNWNCCVTSYVHSNHLMTSQITFEFRILVQQSNTTYLSHSSVSKKTMFVLCRSGQLRLFLNDILYQLIIKPDTKHFFTYHIFSLYTLVCHFSYNYRYCSYLLSEFCGHQCCSWRRYAHNHL